MSQAKLQSQEAMILAISNTVEAEQRALYSENHCSSHHPQCHHTCTQLRGGRAVSVSHACAIGHCYSVFWHMRLRGNPTHLIIRQSAVYGIAQGSLPY